MSLFVKLALGDMLVTYQLQLARQFNEASPV